MQTFIYIHSYLFINDYDINGNINMHMHIYISTYVCHYVCIHS